jgi:hypothetical protein
MSGKPPTSIAGPARRGWAPTAIGRQRHGEGSQFCGAEAATIHGRGFREDRASPVAETADSGEDQRPSQSQRLGRLALRLRLPFASGIGSASPLANRSPASGLNFFLHQESGSRSKPRRVRPVLLLRRLAMFDKVCDYCGDLFNAVDQSERHCGCRIGTPMSLANRRAWRHTAGTTDPSKTGSWSTGTGGRPRRNNSGLVTGAARRRP